jgi:WD40 repeat protein
VLDKATTKHLCKVNANEVLAGSIDPKIRSIQLNPSNKALLVGTYGSEIYELTTKDAAISATTKFTSRNLMKGHYTPNQKWTNEVWGLDVFNTEEHAGVFLTTSDDGTLRIWST